ncbi:unnamed protein product [Spodoptera littoralis]|uniref:Endonuclease/exonuclease/phosphatase domain-containing protein n=1 Tax=Spodoptera littoralis TaxID=7109 RepID=A0A9P0I9Z5_SPOLI|nr:unnamed protein product [Spodoptera littoralis]CAH1642075.1 unnamed protein product [Spodoptera littoralis]
MVLVTALALSPDGRGTFSMPCTSGVRSFAQPYRPVGPSGPRRREPVVARVSEPHKCPEPRGGGGLLGGGAEHSLLARVARRELGLGATRRAHARLVHAHFAPVRTLRLQDDDAYFTHTLFHPTQQQLLAATSSGDIRVFNLFTGIEENSYQVHESYIYHMQLLPHRCKASASNFAGSGAAAAAARVRQDLMPAFGGQRPVHSNQAVPTKPPPPPPRCQQNSRQRPHRRISIEYRCDRWTVETIFASRDGLLLLNSATTPWRPLSALWNMKEFELLFQLDNEEYVEFSKMSDERIIGTKGETATIFDTRTGRELMTLTPAISNQYAKNRATFNPTDELVLSDGVLWDVNTGKEIHKFDKLNQTHSGVFHPNGLEVISNTEVWDLRTFHLLRTVPTLDKSEVLFNPACSALYAVCSDQDAEERSQFDTSFKTLDPYDYSSIATIDVKRNIYALGISRYGTQISLVENMGDFEQMQESCVKIYDVGRKRDHDDDAEEDDEDELAGGSENDDGSDSGSDNDDDCKYYASIKLKMPEIQKLTIRYGSGRDLSTLWLRVDNDDHPRVYACLYRSHSGDSETDRLMDHIQAAVDLVQGQISSAEVVLLGDFNAHHADWLCSSKTDHAGRSVHGLALASGLTQLVTVPTRIPDVEGQKSSLLDLLLTSHPDGYSVSVEAPLGSSDHCLVRSTVSWTCIPRLQEVRGRRVWHYRSADWDGMRSFFASYPWRRVCFLQDDPNAAANSVADVVLQGMELFVPSSLVPVGGRYRPWFDASTRKASRRKRGAYQAWVDAAVARDVNTSALKKEYNFASKSYKRAIAGAKSQHIGRIGERLERLPSGTRSFWSLAKAIEGNFCRPSFPPLHMGEDSLAHNARDKAQLLAKIFASNSTLDDGGHEPPVVPWCGRYMPDVRFHQRTVRLALLSLDVHKSSGPDGIPPIVLKMCAPELAPVLTRLFRLSYSLRRSSDVLEDSFSPPNP